MIDRIAGEVCNLLIALKRKGVIGAEQFEIFPLQMFSYLDNMYEKQTLYVSINSSVQSAGLLIPKIFYLACKEI